MKKIPDFNFYYPKYWEVNKLKKWLKLWNAEKILEKIKLEEEIQNLSELEELKIRKKLGTLVRPFDSEVGVGQIRLLSPEYVENSIPRYIAIIRKWDDENFLVAPFSKFSIPAVQGELETGRDHFSLANLELWNAVIAPFVTLKKSWLADEMTEQETADAFSVFKFISSGEDLPEHLKKKIGAPILKDCDPRIEYQDIETSVFLPFRQKCAEEMAFTEKVFEIISIADIFKMPQLLAADDGTPFSLLYVFEDLKSFESAAANNDWEKYAKEKLSAENISFEIKKDSLDLKWIFDSSEQFNCAELVFIIDKKEAQIIGDGSLIKEKDEPYLIILESTNNTIREDINCKDIFIVLIKR